MRYYAGLDVSKKHTSICIVDENQKILHQSAVETTPELIAEELRQFGNPLEMIGLEASSMCFWLADGLRQEGFPVHVLDARKVADVLSTMINKTDKNDARGIALIVKSGFYTIVHDRSKESIDLSTVLNLRAGLVNERTTAKNRIRGLLKNYGLRFTAPGMDTFIKAVKDSLPALPSEIQKSILASLEVLKHLDHAIKQVDESLDKLIKKDSRIAFLQSVPGIGNITAACFIATIDDPERFRKSPYDVGAYLGLTPKQYSSGEINRQGKISRAGPKYLRSLLYEAALVLLTRTQSWSWLKTWGLKLQQKKGTSKAAVAVARRLAIIMLRMLLTGETFRYQKNPKKNKKQPQEAKNSKAFSKTSSSTESVSKPICLPGVGVSVCMA